MADLSLALRRLGQGQPTAEDLFALIDAAAAGRLVVAEKTEPDPMQMRNALLCEMRRLFYADKRDRPAAEAIATDILRYEAAGWRFDRRHRACPHEAGSLRALQWQVLATGQRVPKWRQLVEIFDADLCSPSPVPTAQNPAHGDDDQGGSL